MSDKQEAPDVLDRWHHGNGVLCNGTLRIARANFDTNPSPEYRDMVFDAICAALNQRISVVTITESYKVNAFRKALEIIYDGGKNPSSDAEIARMALAENLPLPCKACAAKDCALEDATRQNAHQVDKFMAETRVLREKFKVTRNYLKRLKEIAELNPNTFKGIIRTADEALTVMGKE